MTPHIAAGIPLAGAEWVHCLVRLAIMRYVQPGRIADVSRAVDTMSAVNGHGGVLMIRLMIGS